MSSLTVKAVQVASISISLIASGGIAALSVFDVPELQSQPASRSLPSIRWLFSRGSHIFPQAAAVASAGFSYLAYKNIPPGPRVLSQIFSLMSAGSTARGYIGAAVLTISIGPVTSLMIPTNFALIKMNNEKGGARSLKSAKKSREAGAGQRSAEDSVKSEGEAEEFTDLSWPQPETDKESTKEEDEKVRELLSKFATMNSIRAVLIGLGGVLGLLTSLAA